MTTAAGLTDVERSMLELERLTWRYVGAKEDFIRVRFGWSPVTHYARLAQLLRRPEALAYDGPTVRRLQRLAELRRARRSALRGEMATEMATETLNDHP